MLASSGLKATLERLPPKLVEIDGEAPTVARDPYGSEHASAHYGALPFPLPTGTESDLDVAVEIATALVALGEVRSSDPKLEAALTYLEETHTLALKKEDAKAEAPS